MKPKNVKFTPTVESPTWGDVHEMAQTLMELLGGSKAAAEKLSERKFCTLAILSPLNLDEDKSKAFIFGKQYLPL